ncbi:MAG: hypothetical protein V9H69_27260 [Anaerolineae bacterium]|mgnify:CR=1 FL=1|jgi:hypothetical protein
MRIARQLAGILATGYILVYYSEFLFWARVRPGDSLLEWASSWLVYSVMAFVFLSLLARFRVSSIWALFLAGAAFGWLLEGLVVQTTYENLPLSISFTALSWHALITIWAGWYALRRALAAGPGATLLWAAAIGLFYGFWAISWWVEPDGGVALPLDFARFALLTSLPLVIAYWVYDRTVPGYFAPSRSAEIVVAVLLALYFVVVAVRAAPAAAIVLPLLLGALFLALRRHGRLASQESLLTGPARAAPGWRTLCLLALPLTAIAFYSVAYLLGLRWPTNWIVYFVTMPLGFVLLIVSFVKVWRMKSDRLLTTPEGQG